MASAVASKGAPLAGLLKKLTAEPSRVPGAAYYARHPFMSIAAARRFRDSKCFRNYDDEEGEDSSSDSEDDVAVDGRRRALGFSVPVFLSSADLLDQFGAPKTLGQLLSKLEDEPATARSMVALRRGWWVAKQDDDAVTLKVPMPGLGKEHIKVRADQNALVIKGEGHKETAEDKEEELRYNHRIELPADAFKMDQVRAEMNNGLLKVTVPKVKDEDRKDVFHVTVE
ncbi:hypothetical protein PR202_ga17724 [Eleusine coracana subsp. coracana]|uniref:SHSP domain-containing protein n=1 Tax=Eleusine coracana subsp. coracana TaxID=191504 RepID=A0AAV5CRS0_ELECO|nr:hypothetical protein QOZ80_6AG0514010 [Eleusine coracana subsp. coracana]GJN00303.1 hypothetical protein PR202_ga17477 [Eleusine coracana subsp. coracana]GJN00535.1 hypothetical protein PR202_ga17724 [Eleusine coracana subsp. coracana]